MSDFPDNFEMKPGDKASIELRYAEPKTGVVSKGRNEGNTWILYQVQVNNDGEWRGWFTSPDSTAYNAHKMIQKRGYKPGISIDIELTAEAKWIIRGETYGDVFGEQNGDALAALESRTKAAFGIVGDRFKDLEQQCRDFKKQIELLEDKNRDLKASPQKEVLSDDDIPF